VSLLKIILIFVINMRYITSFSISLFFPPQKIQDWEGRIPVFPFRAGAYFPRSYNKETFVRFSEQEILVRFSLCHEIMMGYRLKIIK
jgi:hypothetical protein